MSRRNDGVKSGTESDWRKAVNFVPKSNQIVIYEPDEFISYYRVKVGNGFNNVNDLPFVTSEEPTWGEF